MAHLNADAMLLLMFDYVWGLNKAFYTGNVEIYGDNCPDATLFWLALEVWEVLEQ